MQRPAARVPYSSPSGEMQKPFEAIELIEKMCVGEMRRCNALHPQFLRTIAREEISAREERESDGCDVAIPSSATRSDSMLMFEQRRVLYDTLLYTVCWLVC